MSANTAGRRTSEELRDVMAAALLKSLRGVVFWILGLTAIDLAYHVWDWSFMAVRVAWAVLLAVVGRLVWHHGPTLLMVMGVVTSRRAKWVAVGWVVAAACLVGATSAGHGLHEIGEFLIVAGAAAASPLVFALRVIEREPNWDPRALAMLVRNRLVLPPGTRVRAVLALVFSQRTMRQVVDAVLADVQAEWLDAVVAGRRRLAVWLRIRGYVQLAQHVLAQLPISVARAIYEAWKASKP